MVSNYKYFKYKNMPECLIMIQQSTVKIDRKWNFSFGRNRKSRRNEDTTFGRNRNYTESDYPLSAENRNRKFMRLITIPTPPAIAV